MLNGLPLVLIVKLFPQSFHGDCGFVIIEIKIISFANTVLLRYDNR